MRKLLLTIALLALPGMALGQGGTPNGGYNTGANASSSASSNTINVLDPKYSFPGVGQFVCDATFTNASQTVTITATDPPFSGNSIRNAKVGDIVWGTNAQCGLQGINSPVVRVPQGTITAINGPTSIQVSIAANAACTPSISDGCNLFWGPDATNAVQSAFTDTINYCNGGATLQLPMGGVILQKAINGTSTCQPPTGTNDIPYILNVQGWGPYSTMLMFTPGFAQQNSSSAIFNRFFSNGSSSGARQVFHDFGATSGFSSVSGPWGQFTGFFFAHFYNLWLLNFFPGTVGANGTTALSTTCNNGDTCEIDHNIIANSGITAITMSGALSKFHDNFISTCTGPCLVLTGATGTSAITSHDNLIQLCETQGCFTDASAINWTSENDFFIDANGTSLPMIQFQNSGSIANFVNASITYASTSGPAVNLVAGASVTFDGSSVTQQGAGLNAVNNAGTLTLKNSTLTGGSGAGRSINSSGTVNFKEGNSFPQGITNTGTFQGQRGNGVETGACTGVVTSATTVGLFQLGQLTTTTCVTAVVGLGQVMSKAGTVYALYCTATAGNQATSACTALKNGAAQTMTCSLNALATCTDGATGHTFTYVAGDILSVEAIAGTADTLANVKGLLVTN